MEIQLKLSSPTPDVPLPELMALIKDMDMCSQIEEVKAEPSDDSLSGGILEAFLISLAAGAALDLIYLIYEWSSSSGDDQIKIQLEKTDSDQGKILTISGKNMDKETLVNLAREFIES